LIITKDQILPFRLLCIIAHPDDESAAFGGVLLMAHRDGVETSLLCLTDGQAASNRGEAQDNAELGRMRRAELAGACEVLGISSSEVLHYPDGELLRQNFYELAGAIVERVRLLRPHVIVTFGGDGGANLHRDHTMVSMVSTAAFHWAGRATYFPEQIERGLKPYTPQKLYYDCPPFVRLGKQMGSSDTPTVPYSLSLELGDLFEKKLEAFRKHTSQAKLLEGLDNTMLKRLTIERYLLAAAPGQIAIGEDKGLFDGVKAD
jgi:LmbE family N-acetylglucosaminyl deacetylase